jgi:hypothetical protein
VRGNAVMYCVALFSSFQRVVSFRGKHPAQHVPDQAGDNSAVPPPPDAVSMDGSFSFPVLPTAPPVSSSTPPAEPSGIFYVNLLAILLFGVANSAWLLRFTDYFEVVGGLLALGGLFSWLAFVVKVLPDDRLKAIQKK